MVYKHKLYLLNVYQNIKEEISIIFDSIMNEQTILINEYKILFSLIMKYNLTFKKEIANTLLTKLDKLIRMEKSIITKVIRCYSKKLTT